MKAASIEVLEKQGVINAEDREQKRRIRTACPTSTREQHHQVADPTAVEKNRPFQRVWRRYRLARARNSPDELVHGLHIRIGIVCVAEIDPGTAGQERRQFGMREN